MPKNSSSFKIELNKENILETIHPAIEQTVQGLTKKQILDYYSLMTVEEKKNKLKYYKENFKKIKQGFNESQKSINYYFNAYESILQFRKFILGKLGDINYTFTWSVKEKGKAGNVIIKTVTLDSENFINLLKDNQGNIIGLTDSGGNLRFNNILLNRLKEKIKILEKEGFDITVNKHCTSFSLINEIVGTKQDFLNGKLFKAQIEALQRNKANAKWYIFDIEVSKDISKKEEKAVFKYNVKKVQGSPESSSVFSAIGKYFADEMETKRRLVQQNYNINVDPSYPNAGNLTEMYISAKARLNKGHNDFKERRPVPGQILFQLYNEIKANTEPFYSGGDYLMEQIKSFLGSNPSLTSFSTIEKTVESFYDALNNDNLNQIKKSLSQLLLQKPSTISIITEEEKAMSQAILESFTQFFKDLT